MLYELVVDNGSTELRSSYETVEAAKDAWALTMLTRKTIFSAMLVRYDETGEGVIDEQWEAA